MRTTSSVNAYNLAAAGVIEFILSRNFVTLTQTEDGTVLSGCTVSGRVFTTNLRHIVKGLAICSNQDFHGNASEKPIHSALLAAIKIMARAAVPSGTVTLRVEMPEDGCEWHESSFVVAAIWKLDGCQDTILRAALDAYNAAEEAVCGSGKAAMSAAIKKSSGWYWSQMAT